VSSRPGSKILKGQASSQYFIKYFE